MKTVIAIDIDGTALEYPEKIRNLYYQRDTVIILFTARSWKSAERTVKELREANIPFDALQMEKVKADFYIDDKNSSFDLEYHSLEKENM